MADAVENALVLRGRTFAARTALASRMRVPGRSRRWENAVLGWEVRPRSDVGGVSTRTAPPGIAKDPRVPSVGVRLERPQTPGPLGGGGLQIGEQSPALVAESDPARPVRPTEPATVPSATA